ncbi:SRPBCC domain-containing protein [Nonomuraea ferruginea]
MEYGSIEREIHVDASPEVVFEVVSRPEHISQWWTDDADFEAAPGAVGEFVWGDRAVVSPMTVVQVEPPRLFSFRWCYSDGKVAESLLVTFELTPVGHGHEDPAHRDRVPGDGLGGRQAGPDVPRARRGLGHLRSPARRVRGAPGVGSMTAAVDDDLWSAVGDPTRRRMLDLLLADGSGTATSLSERLPVTRQAIAKHLVVLDRA